MRRIFISAVWTGAVAIAGLGGVGCSRPGPAPIRVLMITGGEHHDYETLPPKLSQRLTGRGEMEIEITSDLARLNETALAPYDVLLFNTCTDAELNQDARRAITGHLRSGKGLVAVHCSLWSFQSWPEWAEIVGGFAPGHDKFGTYPVVVLDPAHATMLSLGGRFEITDEPYIIDKRDPKANVLIRTANVLNDPKGKPRPDPEPQVWTKRWGKGRVFAVTFGHDDKSQSDETFISLMHNGIRWASGRLPDTKHNVLTRSEKQAGYELLFNGRDLTGWTGDPKLWSVENGELVGRFTTSPPHNVFLTCERQFGDFDELRFSVKVLGGNSGVQFRSRQYPEYVVKGYQADAADGEWGNLYDEKTGRGKLAVAPEDEVAEVVRPGGWNDMTVKAVGPNMTITLNGLTTVQYVEADPARPTRGVIALQLHRGPPMQVRFRDIRIRPLGD